MLTRVFHADEAAGHVAQIFNLPYRRFLTCWPPEHCRRAADCKSAIGFPSPPRFCCPTMAVRFANCGQQIENLRYDFCRLKEATC